MGLVILVLVLKFPTGLVTDTIKIWMEGGGVARMEPQLVPFKTIIFYVKRVHSFNDWFIKNLACNIIMFIPYGFLTPLFKKKCKYVGIKVGVSVALVSLGIEIFQYVTALGLFDIDDLMLNVISAILGYWLYKLVHMFLDK